MHKVSRAEYYKLKGKTSQTFGVRTTTVRGTILQTLFAKQWTLQRQEKELWLYLPLACDDIKVHSMH